MVTGWHLFDVGVSNTQWQLVLNLQCFTPAWWLKSLGIADSNSWHQLYNQHFWRVLNLKQTASAQWLKLLAVADCHAWHQPDDAAPAGPQGGFTSRAGWHSGSVQQPVLGPHLAWRRDVQFWSPAYLLAESNPTSSQVGHVSYIFSCFIWEISCGKFAFASWMPAVCYKPIGAQPSALIYSQCVCCIYHPDITALVDWV